MEFENLTHEEWVVLWQLSLRVRLPGQPAIEPRRLRGSARPAGGGQPRPEAQWLRAQTEGQKPERNPEQGVDTGARAGGLCQSLTVPVHGGLEPPLNLKTVTVMVVPSSYRTPARRAL